MDYTTKEGILTIFRENRQSIEALHDLAKKEKWNKGVTMMMLKRRLAVISLRQYQTNITFTPNLGKAAKVVYREVWG